MSNLAEKFEHLAGKYEVIADHARERGDMLLSARWRAKADALWFAADAARKS